MKPAADFAWRRKSKGQRDSFCRPCRAEYHREHYAANRTRYVKEARARKKRLRLTRTCYLLEYFIEHPCSDCGEGDPVVLEFDHVTGEKAFDVGQALPYRNWQSILEEIDKCEV